MRAHGCITRVRRRTRDFIKETEHSIPLIFDLKLYLNGGMNDAQRKSTCPVLDLDWKYAKSCMAYSRYFAKGWNAGVNISH